MTTASSQYFMDTSKKCSAKMPSRKVSKPSTKVVKKYDEFGRVRNVEIPIDASVSPPHSPRNSIRGRPRSSRSSRSSSRGRSYGSSRSSSLSDYSDSYYHSSSSSERFRFDSPPKEFKKALNALDVSAQVVDLKLPSGKIVPFVGSTASVFDKVKNSYKAVQNKASRELHAYGIPLDWSEEKLARRMNAAALKRKLNTFAGNPISRFQIVDSSSREPFGIVEFRTKEECDNWFNLMQQWQASNKDEVEIIFRRPKMGVDAAPVKQEVHNKTTQEHRKKYFDSKNPHNKAHLLQLCKRPAEVVICNLPEKISKKRILDFFGKSGTIDSLYLPEDGHREYRFESYAAIMTMRDIEGHKSVMKLLENLEVDGKLVAVMLPLDAVDKGYLSLNAATLGLAVKPSRCIYLKNFVSSFDDLEKNFQEIYDDIREESESCGNLIDFVLVKPGKDRRAPGLGYCFIEYEKLEEAIRAKNLMDGREFASNVVEAEFVDESLIKSRNFNRIEPNTTASVPLRSKWDR